MSGWSSMRDPVTAHTDAESHVEALAAGVPHIVAATLRRLAPKMSCQEDCDQLYGVADRMDSEREQS